MLTRDLENGMDTAEVEHFLYEDRSEQYRQHVVEHYPAETQVFTGIK